MKTASEGGGGKGIRLANTLEELKTNFIQVQNEVPGSPVFMMKLCTQARHIEVQIVGDEHGKSYNSRDFTKFLLVIWSFISISIFFNIQT